MNPNLVGVARATTIDDTGDLQRMQITEGAQGNGGSDLVTDNVPRIAEFGLASVPPLQSVVAVMRRCGERSRSFVFGSSHTPSRPRNLKPGDTVLYDVRGAKVQLIENGLLIDCAGLPAVIQNATTVTIKASDKIVLDADVEITKSLKVGDDIIFEDESSDISVKALHDAYNAHKHPGVTTGSGSTGATDHAV